MTVDYVDAVSRADKEVPDSVHLLVMDLHRELNRLQMGIAVESLDGARVYRIHDTDRPLVAAFMAGINSTDSRRRRAKSRVIELDPP